MARAHIEHRFLNAVPTFPGLRTVWFGFRPAPRHRKKFSYEKLQRAFEEEVAHVKETWLWPGKARYFPWTPGVERDLVSNRMMTT